VSTLIDILSEAGLTLKERAPRMHKQLVIHILNRYRNEGITARGIERTLRQIADLEIKLKYSQSKYDSYSPERLLKEKKRDYQLLTLSTTRIIEILEELEKNDKMVTKTVIAKNYHIYKLRRLSEQVSDFWHIQSLLAYHYLMKLPTSNNKEEKLEEYIQRIGVFVISVFLNASREFGQNLSKEKQDDIRFDYIDGNISPRFMYNKIMPFFIAQNQRSITEKDFDHLEFLLKKKYAQYIDKIAEGAREAERWFQKKDR
jgi:hypothetical protein